MPWFKVDDGFWSHPKTLQLSDGAQALWMRAGSWSMHQLTDGFIPSFALPILSAKPRYVGELLDVSLWILVEGGHQFHDWKKYQPTREQVEQDRRDAAERKRKSREKSQGESHVTDGDAASGVTPTPTRPDPTRSSNELLKPSRAKAPSKGTRLPEPFIVNGDMRGWARDEVPSVDVDAATRSFVDYWRGRAGAGAVKVDWVATWRNSLRGVASRSAAKPAPEQRARSTVALATELLGIES